MKRDPVYDKMGGKKPIVKVACRLRFLPRRVLKSVFEAALPPQKHLEASFASPHADVRRSSRRSVSDKHGENYALFPPSSFTKSKQLL